MTDLDQTFASCQSRLRGLAYRMLGSNADAEDILQDAYVRVRQADQTSIRNAEAYLMTTVTRLCLDHLRSARVRREVYVGPWLPEPIADTEALSPETAVEYADDLSFALLLTLETLSAPERAAFLLHDVFSQPYSQVADTLGKSEAACRQLAARARKTVRHARPKQNAAPDTHQALLVHFAEAVSTGNITLLESFLAQDVVAYSDGGGIKSAALNPIKGPNNVARFFVGLVRKYRARGGSSEYALTTINGTPGFIVYLDGIFDQTLSIDIKEGRIAAFYLVRNPEKLQSVAATLQ